MYRILKETGNFTGDITYYVQRKTTKRKWFFGQKYTKWEFVKQYHPEHDYRYLTFDKYEDAFNYINAANEKFKHEYIYL